MEKSTALVIANYDKVLQEKKTKRMFEFRIELFYQTFVNFLKKYFTREIETQEEKLHYTEIFTLTEKGMEKLKEMPKNITFLITKKEDA